MHANVMPPPMNKTISGMWAFVDVANASLQQETNAIGKPVIAVYCCISSGTDCSLCTYVMPPPMNKKTG